MGRTIDIVVAGLGPKPIRALGTVRVKHASHTITLTRPRATVAWGLTGFLAFAGSLVFLPPIGSMPVPALVGMAVLKAFALILFLFRATKLSIEVDSRNGVITVRNLASTALIDLADVAKVVVKGSRLSPGLVIETSSGLRLHSTAFSPVKNWGRLGYPDENEMAEILQARRLLLEAIGEYRSERSE